MTRRAFLCGAACAALLPAPALAHREKTTTTRVEWTGKGFAVTHTIHRHDAETALARAGLIDRPDIDSLKSRAHIALHVEETFRLEGLPLTTLGAETEGNRIYIYQEAPLDALPATLSVDARILRSLYADQVNAVDVVVDGEVTSLRFADGDGAKTVTLS